MAKRQRLTPEQRPASAKRGVETRRANAASNVPRIPKAKAEPKINVLQSAGRGTLGKDLKKLNPTQLSQLATKSGVAVAEGASPAAIRKAVGAAAYASLGQARQLSGGVAGAAPRAAAALARAPAAAGAAAPATSAIAQAGKFGFDAAQKIATGYATGGQLGAVKAGVGVAASNLKTPKGKAAAIAAATGYVGYEGYQGYKKDGLKGAAFGAADSIGTAVNYVLPGALALPENVVSKIAGYDYGEAAKAAKAEKEKQDAEDAADPSKVPPPNEEIKIPSLAQGFNPFKSQPRVSPVDKSSMTRDRDGNLNTATLLGGGLAVGVAGAATGEFGRRAAANAASTTGIAKAGNYLLAAGLKAGGKAALIAGATAATVGGLKAAVAMAPEPPKPRGLFGAIEGGGKIATDIRSKQAQEAKIEAEAKMAYGKTGKLHTAKEIAVYEKKLATANKTPTKAA